MPPSPPSRYCVWSAHDGRSHAHEVVADSFIQAAAEFVEVWHPAPDDDGDEVTVLVVSQDSGEQQCFVVQLSAGEVQACS